MYGYAWQRKAIDQSAAKASLETAHYMTNVSTALVFNPFRDDGQERTYAGEWQWRAHETRRDESLDAASSPTLTLEPFFCDRGGRP